MASQGVQEVEQHPASASAWRICGLRGLCMPEAATAPQRLQRKPSSEAEESPDTEEPASSQTSDGDSSSSDRQTEQSGPNEQATSAQASESSPPAGPVPAIYVVAPNETTPAVVPVLQEAQSSDAESAHAPVQQGAPGGHAGAAARGLCEEALRLGRLDEALRQQQRQEEEQLDAATVERLQRLSEHYARGRQVCGRRPSEFPINEENKALRLHWGAEVADGYIRMMHVWETDMDLAKVMSIRMEKDFQKMYNDDIIDVIPVGEREPAFAIWRSRNHIKSVGSKSDEMFSSCAINAVHEPAGSVFLIDVNLPAGVAEFEGVAVPPPMEGHERSPSIFGCLCGSPTASGGSRWVGYMEFKMAPLMYKLMSVMPRFVLKKVLRAQHEKEFTTVRDRIAKSTELQQRVQSSPSAPFYRQLEIDVQAMQK